MADREPHHAGVYLNFLDRRDETRALAAFASARYERLRELQHRWDPAGVLSAAAVGRVPALPATHAALRAAR